MTNLTNIDLSTLNLKDLQTLAKEFKIKSWWTMKKADLIISLGVEKVNQEDDEAVRRANEKYQKELQEKDKKAERDFNGGNAKFNSPNKSIKDRKSKSHRVEKNQDNLVTLKELASEFGMKGTKARRLLRNETAARPYGGNRWEWDSNLHREELQYARSILKSHTK